MDIKKYWEETLSQNAVEMKKYFHEVARIRWHNTKETFTVDEFIKVNCDYPGEWDGIVEKIEIIGNEKDKMYTIITVVHVFSKDNRVSHHVTSFIKMFENKIFEIDEYWGEDGEAPKWRQNKENKEQIIENINVLGLGPGSLDYILPATLKEIEKSDIVIGGKRNIESLEEYARNKEHYYIRGDLQEIIEYINKNRNKKIALILSGDTGFYSMLTFIKKYYKQEELNVIPGLSSIQYMFAKISDYWYDAYISSVHGKELDYVSKLKEYRTVGLLTDNNNTPQEISRVLTENELGETTVFVGENLSYEDEKIYKYKARELKDSEYKFKMNVVILKI